jgi:Protein of unknown function (DUF2637)
MSTLELSQSDPGPLRMPAETAGLPRLPAASNAADTAIRVSTAAVVLAVAGIAAYISYWHAYAVVRQYGEGGVTALLEPATIDGLVYASSMVILHAARHRLPVPGLAPWMLALGITASLAVNVAQGWSHGLVGAAAAAWPAVALVGSYELLAWMIRTATGGGPDRMPSADHGVPQTDQPGTIRRPAVALIREAVPAAAPGNGTSPETESAHDQFPAACTAAQVLGSGPGGPGGPGCTDQAGRSGRAPDHVDRAGRRPPDRLPPRHRTMTSAPLQSPPTAPASERASRCPSASWRRRSARPHGGGHVTGWPKPGRDRPRADWARTDGAPTGRPAFERCVTRYSPCAPSDTRGGRPLRVCPSAGRLRRVGAVAPAREIRRYARPPARSDDHLAPRRTGCSASGHHAVQRLSVRGPADDRTYATVDFQSRCGRWQGRHLQSGIQ